MKRKVLWLAATFVVLLGVAASLIVALSGANPATAQLAESQVPEALRQALNETGVPVRQITPTSDDCGSPEYLVVLDDAGTSNNVNAELTFEQATALCARGMPINALQVDVVNASGENRFEMAMTLEADSVKLGEAPDEATMSAAEVALMSAVDDDVAPMNNAGAVKRDDVSMALVGNGLVLARVALQVPDAATESALEPQLVEKTVESCRTVASTATFSVASVVLTVVDESGTKLLDYWENLATGSCTAYCAPGTGHMRWKSHGGPAHLAGGGEDQGTSQ